MVPIGFVLVDRLLEHGFKYFVNSLNLTIPLLIIS